MLFLSLGNRPRPPTLILDRKTIVPLEVAHLPYRNKKTFEDHVGQRGLDRYGKKRWRIFVADVATRLRLALVADYVVLGGGNSRLMRETAASKRMGKNTNAFIGGFRMWDMDDQPPTLPRGAV